MAAGDFADLQLNLARLTGRPTAADLDDDLYLAKQVINEAYLECYQPPEGGCPPWARYPEGLQFAAPVTATIGVTQGSKIFTGYTPATSKVGSVVRIGNNWYTYAGLDGSDQKLVEPVQEATGSTVATFYHNSYPLSAALVQVMQSPVLLGFGPLSPFGSKQEQIIHQASFRGDFVPAQGAGFSPQAIGWGWGGMAFDVGQPMYYRADAATLLATAAYATRFVVYPLPSQICTVTLEAHWLPTSLSADADLPRMPAAKIYELLLPIAREKWALTFKKYAGDNKDALVMAADRARRQLALLANPQQDRPQRVRARFT